MRLPVLPHALLAWLLFVCACATSNSVTPEDGGAVEGDGGAEQSGPLRFMPEALTAVTAGDEQRLAFTLLSDTHGDVTARASYTVEPPQFAVVDGKGGGGALVVPAGLNRGARVTVTARFGGRSAALALLVRFVAADALQMTPPQNPQRYFGADESGDRPGLAYPLDGAIMPRNWPLLSVHFRAPPASFVYRLRLACPTFAQDIYLGPGVCTAPASCVFELPDALWQALSESCAGEELQVSLSAAGSELGKPIGTDGPLRLRLSRDPLKETIYYNSVDFATGNQTLMRMILGTRKRQVFRAKEQGCAGCHTVSRDGRRVAYSAGYGGGGGILDGRNGLRDILKPPQVGTWNFSTFSPAGDQLLVNEDGDLRLLGTTQGELLARIPSAIRSLVTAGLIQPDLSPDGQTVAFVRAPVAPVDDFRAVNAGDLMLMPLNRGQFAPPELVLARSASANHYYPTWTPDGQALLFNSVLLPCNPSPCRTFDNRNTVLRYLPLSTRAPVDLLRARSSVNSGGNYPRTALKPIDDGRLLFFLFGSRMTMGVTKTTDKLNLWVAAIDLEKAQQGPGTDPSGAPLWVPDQQVSNQEQNYMGVFTSAAACLQNSDCPENHRCVAEQCTAILQ